MDKSNGNQKIRLASTSGQLVSHIPRIMTDLGWAPNDLKFQSQLAGFPLGYNSALKAANGSTNFNLSTLQKLCCIFDLPVDQIITFKKDIDPA